MRQSHEIRSSGLASVQSLARQLATDCYVCRHTRAGGYLSVSVCPGDMILTLLGKILRCLTESKGNQSRLAYASPAKRHRERM